MSTTMKGPAATTADGRLNAKSRDGAVISGGHLVTEALKAEGLDTISVRRGDHRTPRRS